jgi:uncharacterized protein (UPF0332 family)
MTPQCYLQKAGRALASAKLLLDDGDTEGACNRAYYAMFDAAHAALLRLIPEINPAEIKTHRGLIGAFGKHLVKTGIVAPELGRSLNAVEDVRLLADYSGNQIELSEAGWAVAQAEAFVQTVSQLSSLSQ